MLLVALSFARFRLFLRLSSILSCSNHRCWASKVFHCKRFTSIYLRSVQRGGQRYPEKILNNKFKACLRLNKPPVFIDAKSRIPWLEGNGALSSTSVFPFSQFWMLYISRTEACSKYDLLFIGLMSLSFNELVTVCSAFYFSFISNFQVMPHTILCLSF